MEELTPGPKSDEYRGLCATAPIAAQLMQALRAMCVAARRPNAKTADENLAASPSATPCDHAALGEGNVGAL